MPHRIGIIGGGPRCVFALERLTAVIAKLRKTGELSEAIDIHVFDPSGSFGDGAVHSSNQLTINRLNVLAGQTTAFADETVRIANSLEYPPCITPQTLHQYLQSCGRKIEEHDFPYRYEFGNYLRHVIDSLRRNLPSFTQLSFHRLAAVDIEPTASDFYKVSFAEQASGEVIKEMEFNYILLVTGHGIQWRSNTQRT